MFSTRSRRDRAGISAAPVAISHGRYGRRDRGFFAKRWQVFDSRPGDRAGHGLSVAYLQRFDSHRICFNPNTAGKLTISKDFENVPS